MNITLLTRGRKWFNSPVLSREANRAHIHKWVASLRFLGPRWVLRRPAGGQL